jgi:hypothetical protein
MANIALDLVAFRLQFPELSTVADANVIQYWNNTTMYQSNLATGNIPRRTFILQLFTAHLIQLSKNIADNTIPNMVSGATIGGETVTLVPPPVANQYQWWLNLTIYGQQVAALSKLEAVGGLYVGGAFRKGGGLF